VNKDRKQTVSHFVKEGYLDNTIRLIIRRYVKRGSIEYLKINGRTPTVCVPNNIAAVNKKFAKDRNTSIRIVADQVDISKSSVGRIKRNILGMKGYSVKTIPKYNPDQERRAKTNCRKLAEKRYSLKSGKVLIMDDETYVPIDPKDVPGRKFVHCKDFSEVSDENLFQGNDRYFKKLMVWQAIDENGRVSDPYIIEGTLNGSSYLKECLKKRLLPFIDKYHKREDILFWADMSRVHYTNEVTDWLTSTGIDFLSWKENAPKVPQARPIEKFWALCKAQYKKRKTIAKNKNSFIRIWKNIASKVAEKSGVNLMKDVRKKIRLIGRKGVRALFRQ
jgi:hypothetical protein